MPSGPLERREDIIVPTIVPQIPGAICMSLLGSGLSSYVMNRLVHGQCRLPFNAI
jgi:hypothetical protein